MDREDARMTVLREVDLEALDDWTTSAMTCAGSDGVSAHTEAPALAHHTPEREDDARNEAVDEDREMADRMTEAAWA